VGKSRNDKNLRFIPAKNGNPGYYVTDVTLNWKRVRRFAGRTKQAAKNYLSALRIAAKDGRLEEFIKPRPDDTFGEYARALLNSAEWKKKRSASRNEISLKHLNKAFRDTRLCDINPGSVRKYISKRIDSKKSPATVNRELSLLKSILYAAEYDGVIASNPIRGKRVKKLAEESDRAKVLLSLGIVDNDEAQARLVESACPHFRPIVEIALLTGMRKGEILNMKWKDISFPLRSIRIPAENAKTKRERYVPIDSNLFVTLDSIEKKSEYVFMNDWTGKHRKDIREAFRKACKRAGIPSGRKNGITFHDLRHLAAYRLVKTTDIVTASKILGHASIQMTMKYVHPTDHDKHEAMERAGEKLYRTRQNHANGENQLVEKRAENGSNVH